MSENMIIAVTNSKGGVGKTTTVLNLGAALYAASKKVLLIDNDPQGNLTAALGYTPAEQRRTLANLLLAAIDYPEDIAIHLQRAVLHTECGIDLIAANKRLADAAARLQVMQLSQYNALGDVDRTSEKVMDTVLDQLEDHYDYIIIDCGLKHELLTVNALAAADYCIIPVQSHFLASEGIPDVLDMVRAVQQKFNPRLQIAGILLTMYPVAPAVLAVRVARVARVAPGISAVPSTFLSTSASRSRCSHRYRATRVISVPRKLQRRSSTAFSSISIKISHITCIRLR